ncbi:MAG TPA: SRPBCC family protein [Acidimicrobiales bacterium]|nr:SRPBCC family protein [Acidimicrobiales bacterium]
MKERELRDAVCIDIAAPPERVYELISDITRMGEWSPECYQCVWSHGATGPVVGARFKAKNKGGRGPSWSNSPVVTSAELGREFAFNRKGPAIGSYTWRYVMEPTPTGTKLTESFNAERRLGRAMTWLTMKWTGSVDRDVDLHQGMITTLGRIKAAAES